MAGVGFNVAGVVFYVAGVVFGGQQAGPGVSGVRVTNQLGARADPPRLPTTYRLPDMGFTFQAWYVEASRQVLGCWFWPLNSSPNHPKAVQKSVSFFDRFLN